MAILLVDLINQSINQSLLLSHFVHLTH